MTENGGADRPTLLVEPDEARRRLLDQVKKGQELASVTHLPTVGDWFAAVDRWMRYTTQLLRSLFSTDEYSDAFAASAQDARGWMHDSNRAKGTLLRLVNVVTSAAEIVDIVPTSRSAGADFELTPERARSVFLVHGHDQAARDAVSSFVRRLGLKVTVLSEEAGEGRTIIEQFELHSDVGFAIVLLTADDVGASSSTPDERRPRARQNVVLELGYFFGRLGRGRVRALVKGEVEYPSDIGGVLYTRLDDEGAWQSSLAKEMRKAGMDVDLNDL